MISDSWITIPAIMWNVREVKPNSENCIKDRDTIHSFFMIRLQQRRHNMKVTYSGTYVKLTFATEAGVMPLNTRWKHSAITIRDSLICTQNISAV